MSTAAPQIVIRGRTVTLTYEGMIEAILSIDNDIDSLQRQKAHLFRTARDCAEVPAPIRRKIVGAAVYFIRCGARLKIGFSSDVNRRLAELQQANPHRLQVIAVVPGRHAEEVRAHKAFAAWHMRGEWFYYTSQCQAFLTEYVKGCEARHG